MKPNIVNVRTVYDGWAKVSIATVESAQGATFERLMENHGGGVCVLAFDPDRKVAMMVRQFRAPVFSTTQRADLLEVVAGLVEGEPPEQAIVREALEEAGLKLGKIELVATVWTMPGISTERMDMFLARYCEADRVGRGGGNTSEHENITVEELPLSGLAAAADKGLIEDMKTFALLQTLRLREPGLFQPAST